MQVWFQSRMAQLKPLCSSSSMGSNIPLLASFITRCTLDTQIHMQPNTHICKTKDELKREGLSVLQTKVDLPYFLSRKTEPANKAVRLERQTEVHWLEVQRRWAKARTGYLRREPKVSLSRICPLEITSRVMEYSLFLSIIYLTLWF